MTEQTTDTERAKILADFHVGMTQNQLSIKYERSKATIHKICKGVIPLNIEKVNTLVRIETELAEQSEQNVKAVRSLVDRKTRDLDFFRDASLLVTKAAIQKVKKGDASMFDLSKAQEIIGKGKENIYGKAPETQVQVNNQQNQQITYKWEDE